MAKITTPNKITGDFHSAAEYNAFKTAINDLHATEETHTSVLTFDKNKFMSTSLSQSAAINYTLATTGNIDGMVIRHKILSDGVNPITFSADFNVFGKSDNDIYPLGLHIFYFNYVGGDVDVAIPTYSPSSTSTPTNTAPSSTADSYSVDENQVLTIAAPGVLANDSDADADSLTAILVTQATNGTVNLSADGSFTYTPNVDYFGSDSFTYKTNDGTEDGNTATVTITVNEVVTDTTAPTMTSATIEDASPSNLVVVFSEVVNITNLTGLSITGTGAPTINSVSGTGTNTLTFVLSAAATNGDAWTLDVAGTNTITDNASNALATTTQAITNNVGASTSPYEFFGLRKHNTSYAGPAITVKADGFTEENDIGFDANGDLDTAAIAALSSSATFRVTKLYGQYNGNILSQTTETKMPVIMVNGVAQTLESANVMSFNTSSTQLTGGTATLTAENGLTALIVTGTTSTSGSNKGLFGKWGATAEYLMMLRHFATPNDISIASKNSSDTQTNSQSGIGIVSSQLTLITGVWSTTEQYIRINGVERKRDAITGVRSGTNPFVLGGYELNATTNEVNTKISELFIYKSEIDPSTDEAEINAKYTIY